MTTSHMKPVKAWASHKKDGSIVGYWLSEPDKSKAKNPIPVTITDARWITRAEFEASDYRGWCWICLEDSGSTYSLPAYYKGDSVYVFFEGGLAEEVNASCMECSAINHAMPIYPPAAPSEG